MTKNKGGRPPLDPDVYGERIAEALRQGNYVETACAKAGLHKDTFYEWLKKARRYRDGRGKETPTEIAPYLRFTDAIENASAEGEAELLGTIREASYQQWQAAAWMLERRHPDKWGRRTAHRLENTAGEAMDLDALRNALHGATHEDDDGDPDAPPQ